MSLRLSELRTAGRAVLRLVTLGALISWFLTTLFKGSGRRASVGDHLRGRLLFDKQLSHDELEGRMENGFPLKKTRSSEEFTLEDFIARYGTSATILFVIDEAGHLAIPIVAVPLKPKPGHTIIGLVDATEAEHATQTTGDQSDS